MTPEHLALQKEHRRLQAKVEEMERQFLSLRLMVVECQRIEQSACAHLERAVIHLTRYAVTEKQAEVVEKMYVDKSQHELDKAAKSCV